MNCSKCGYMMDAFDAECPRCHGKGIPQPQVQAQPQPAPPVNPAPPAPPPSHTQAPIVAANQQPPRAGAVRFTPQSPEAIRAEAERMLRRNTKSAGNTTSFAAVSTVAWFPWVGCFCLIIPVVGIFLCALFWIATFVGFFGSGGLFLFSRLGPVNQEQLAGLTHKLRNMVRGNCPVCKSDIWLAPNFDPEFLVCPKCSTTLLCQGGWVSPH